MVDVHLLLDFDKPPSARFDRIVLMPITHSIRATFGIYRTKNVIPECGLFPHGHFF